MEKDFLLCDFHIHTSISDGDLPLSDVIDLYGKAGFDCIAITDHIISGESIIDKVAVSMKKMGVGGKGYYIEEHEFPFYLKTLKKEEERAWELYRMIVIPGVEISKNAISEKEGAHIVALDINEYISAKLEPEEILLEIIKQDGVSIACHPHKTESSHGRETLYLWNNRDYVKDIVHLWEIANRDDLFNVISLKKFPYVANSDFHKQRHIYSWKTILMKTKKDKYEILKALKRNENVAITLFREKK
ncbi:MAG: PHP domain-containing protein [Candidatus Aminicenantia bacterium]